MKIPFYKYEGTGNDFVLIDNRTPFFQASTEEINRLCDRRFGIGADGLILLQDHVGFDYEMVYYNADGRLGSLCGNGSRCLAAFAKKMGVVSENATFLASDGYHEVVLKENGDIKLKMSSVNIPEMQSDYAFLDTGSPHYIQFVDSVDQVMVVERGREIRYNDRFREKGTNVNFVEAASNSLMVRTYERGVEDETLSCGTGVTASALAAALRYPSTTREFWDIMTLGGKLRVYFQQGSSQFTDIWLEGPANLVFTGEITIQ